MYVIGGEGLQAALIERDLKPVVQLDEGAVGVAQGFGPSMPWRQVVDGAILVREGLPWVATNTDLTMPTQRGIGPGNGALVRLVAEFAGREPQVAGKPARPLFEETLLRVGGRRPLVIGDRLDTDIEGAVRMGWDSLLVMTGVTDLEGLVAAPLGLRPTYLATGLSCLADPVDAPTQDSGVTALGGWSARVIDGQLEITGSGGVDDWFRVAAAAGWAFLDETGDPVSLTAVAVPDTVSL